MKSMIIDSFCAYLVAPMLAFYSREDSTKILRNAGDPTVFLSPNESLMNLFGSKS